MNLRRAKRSCSTTTRSGKSFTDSCDPDVGNSRLAAPGTRIRKALARTSRRRTTPFCASQVHLAANILRTSTSVDDCRLIGHLGSSYELSDYLNRDLFGGNCEAAKARPLHLGDRAAG